MKVLRKYKNILVTGGDGFIGINYVKMLVSNKRKYGYNELVVVDNGSKGSNNLIWSDEFKNKIIPYNVDICDADSIDYIFKKHKIDCVVHFAAESHVDRSITDPLGFVKTNVIGTATLLNTAKNHWGLNDKTLFHHVSTDEVFGEALEDKFKETNVYDPRSPYSASKASSDHLVRSFYHTYDLNITISNCGNNYGPYQDNEKLIPKVIENALTDTDIPVYGDGTNKRNWLFVEDHCKAIQDIIQSGRIGETYLVGSENTFENIQIIKTILKNINKPESLITFVEDRPGHDAIYDINSDKIRKELKWNTETDLESGLNRTIEFYKNKLEANK